MEQSYKEKYEQAIERLKQWDREHPCAGYVLSDRDKFIFPELAEFEEKPNGGIVREDFTQGDGWYKVNLDYLSKAQVEEIEQLVEKWNPKEVSEEEKIKKAILIYLDWLDGKKDYLPKGDYTIKDMILWIEKQGRVKESAISQHENRTCEENGNSLTYKNEKVRKEIINYFQCQSEEEPTRKEIHNKWIAWLEKQEGCEYIKKDWLEHIKQSWYKEGFIDGKYSGGTSKEWTINDVAIFKEIIDFLENGTAKLQHDLTKYANWLKIQFTPIEKQGRQFSVDKLEPKFKVGDKIRRKTPSSFDKDMQVARIEKDYYVCNHIGKFSSEVVPFSKQSSYELVEPKQGWRAEEEAVLDALIRRLKGEDIYVSPHLAVECLESLKGRVLPKQEWSEDDEQHIDSLLKRLDALCRNKFERTRFAISEDIDWLKSLRPQNRWKPSDEQMEALDWQVENTSVGSWQYKATKELMADLKKLKEKV